MKLIIFDYDDTLARSSDFLYATDSATATMMGLLPANREQYFALWGLPHEEMIKVLYPGTNFAEYLTAYEKVYNPVNLKLFDGTKKLIRDLSSIGLMLSILTSKRQSFLEQHMKMNEIDQYFRYLHTAESSIYKKPDPRVFDDTLAHFSVEPSEALYVGDQIQDFRAATDRKMNFLAVTTGITGRNDFIKEGCTTICPDLASVGSKIREIVATTTNIKY